MSFRRLPYFVGLAISASVTSSSFGQVPDLFPEPSPPFVIPDAEPKRESPFLEEAEALKPPRGEMMQQGAGALNNLFSHQWVQTNGTGSLRGTVVTLSGEDTLSVSGTRVILSQRGKVIANTTSNPDGAFSFANVAPGYYSIVAEADNSFATFGLAVLGRETGSHLPTALEIRVIRPKGDTIRRILGVEMSPNSISGTMEGTVQDPIPQQRTFAKSHRILSSEDGRITGRLSKLGIAPEVVDMSQMKTMLLKDGNEIGRADVMRDGTFVFNGVAPGCYGLVAAGNRGVAAVAFCVIKPDTLAMKRTADGKFFVAAGALQDSASSSLNVELADGADVATVEEEITAEEEVAPLAMTPMAGQFGAGQIIGGGGGTGLGGFGDLLQLAALAGAAYLIADQLDDDEDSNVNNNNAIASPITQ